MRRKYMRILRPTLTFGILLSMCMVFMGCGTDSNVSGDWRADVVAHEREGNIVRVALMLTNASDSESRAPSTSKSNYRIIDDMGIEYESSRVVLERSNWFTSFFSFIPIFRPKRNPGFSVIVGAEFMVLRSARGLSVKFREGGFIPSRFVTLDLPY